MANRTLSLAVFSTALLLRLGYLADVADSPYFDTLILDAESYDYLAEELSNGNWRLDDKQTYVHGLVYPAAMAVVKMVGGGPLVVRILQAVLGAVSCLLVFRIASRLFDSPVPLIAGLLASAYWPYLFFGGELFATTLFVFLQLFLVDLLLRFEAFPPLRRCAAAGLLLGLLIATRANALLALPVAVWWIHRRTTSVPGFGRTRIWVGFSLVLALTLSPFVLRNYLVQGGPVPFQGGWSFYMGTNPSADGTPYVRQGLQWQRHELLPLRAGITVPAAKGLFYLNSGLQFVFENPLDYLCLQYRKFRLFWHAFEIPVSSDLSYYREHSVLHRILIIDFGVIAPLALAGLIASRRRHDGYFLLWGFVLAYLATGMLFTVSARYRVPATPFLIIAAAHAVWQAILIVRARSAGTAALFVAVLVATAVLVHTGVDQKQVDHVRSDLLLGMAYHRGKQYANAEAAYSKALESYPDDADLLNSLGTLYGDRRRHRDAEAAFAQSVAAAADYAQPRFNLASLYRRLGRNADAISALEQALEIDLRPTPQYQGNLTLGNVYMEERRFRDAIGAFERALAHRKGTHAYYGLSHASGQLGDVENQLGTLEKAVQLDSTFAPALRNLGALYAMRGQVEQAEEALLQSLRHDPGSAVAHENLGSLYTRRGQLERARVAFARAEQLRRRTGAGGGLR